MKIVNRTAGIPAYIFSRFDEIKKTLRLKGMDIIDLGIGDPDIPTPEFIINSMNDSIKDAANHKYPPYSGIDEFKMAVAEYYKKNYGVVLDYKTEVAALIGSKEGIAHLFLAMSDPGDYVLLPDPAYPVYYAAAVVAGCSIYKMPLQEKNGYLPKIENIDGDVARKAKLLFVNYPNNPTGAVADKEFYRKVIKFGLDNEIAIVNDGAYLGIYPNGEKPLSILQTEAAKDIAVEFGSLSKLYNMTGWRIGYVAGSKEIIERLMVIKTNFDSGQFAAIQKAGAAALMSDGWFTEYINEVYRERRSIVLDKLCGKGFHVFESRGGFYVWFRVPEGYKSEEFTSGVLEKTGVLITPGNAFGSFGEGYCRISLTVDTEILNEAVNRIISI